MRKSLSILALLAILMGCDYNSNPTGPSENTVPPAPTGVKVTNGAGAYITWEPVKPTTYISIGSSRALPVPIYYNIYWSTTPGVTKETGNKIPGVRYPQHFNPDFYAPIYYIVITAVNEYGESPESQEVISDWRPQ